MCGKGSTGEQNIGGGSVLRSKRWRLCFLLFLAYTVLLLHRVNLSMAVVCMSPTSSRFEEGFNSSCSTNNTAKVILQNGTSSAKCLFRSNHVRREGYIVNTNESQWHSEAKNTTDAFKSDTFTVDWSKSLISVLLSSYFYGSIMTQVLGGKMADVFGGKVILFVAYVTTAVSSLLTPVCIKTHMALAFVVRIVVGMASGVVVPAGVAMIGAWAPPTERAAMIALSGCGVSIGPAVSYLTSGYLCAYGFDGGVAAGLFAVLWWFQAFNSPKDHPSISRRELSYILEARKDLPVITNVKTPWGRMMVSRPLWASAIAHFAFNWGFYTVLINVPMFMKELLLFDITQNAFYSALPYICLCVSNIFWTKVSLTILSRRWLSVLAVRRGLTCISLFGSSLCLIVVGQMTIDLRHYAVILLCLTCVLTSMCFSGVLANHAEYAGTHSGTAYGLSNSVAVVSAILAAIMAGVMTPNGSQWEWQTVFYLSAGVSVFGAIVFYFFSSSTLEPWAEKRLEIAVTIENGDTEMESLAISESKQNA